MDSNVPVPPRTVSALRCGRCGGSFQEDDAACPWCAAGIALEDRRRSHVCAHCASRAPAGAEWCPQCGHRLGEQPLAALSAEARCPACQGTLRERLVGQHRMTECGGCGGLWLAAAILDELCGAADRAGIANVAPVPPAAEPERTVRYRACMACAAIMSRRNFGGSSGVIVDVCREHGVWLDHRELERVLAWARAGGLERERQRRVERARRATARDRPVAVPMSPVPDRDESGFDLLEAIARLVQRLG